jgi:hypothetical protein
MGTHATRAWRGAINILGSAYSSGTSNSTGNNNRNKKTTNKGTNQAGSISNYFTPAKTSNETQPATISPIATTLNPYKKIEKACIAEQQRSQSVRLMVALKLEKHETKTPNDLAFESISAMFGHYLKNDKATCIYPWKIADMDVHPAITQVKDIPKKMSEFKKVYA